MITNKKCKVVMLSTYKAEKGCLRLYKGKSTKLYLAKTYLTQSYLKSIQETSKHLYILSDDTIQEGDYVIDSMGEVFGPYEKGDIIGKEAKKIIATTDISLRLPRIPQSFINEYIIKYNKGDQVKKVMVQYHNNLSDPNRLTDFDVPWAKDNIIIINLIKTTFDRDDILHAFTSGHNKAKMGLTHSDALLEYKREQNL